MDGRLRYNNWNQKERSVEGDAHAKAQHVGHFGVLRGGGQITPRVVGVRNHQGSVAKTTHSGANETTSH